MVRNGDVPLFFPRKRLIFLAPIMELLINVHMYYKCMCPWGKIKDKKDTRCSVDFNSFNLTIHIL